MESASCFDASLEASAELVAPVGPINPTHNCDSGLWKHWMSHLHVPLSCPEQMASVQWRGSRDALVTQKIRQVVRGTTEFSHTLSTPVPQALVAREKERLPFHGSGASQEAYEVDYFYTEVWLLCASPVTGWTGNWRHVAERGGVLQRKVQDRERFTEEENLVRLRDPHGHRKNQDSQET